MGDPISWYALPRTVDDPESIMEAIDEKLLDHNMDPSAHGQSDEAVHSHRISPQLDHVNYSIYNVKQNPAVRPFKAVVGPTGIGDFEDLQEALDYANLHGGGTVFVKEGTYVLTTDVTIYSNIKLVGEDDESVIFDANNTSNRLEIHGSAGNLKRNIEIQNVTVKNCDISYGDDAALSIKYAENVTVKECIFNNNNNETLTLGDIGIEDSLRIFIRNNRFKTDTYVGINYDDSEHVEITSNYITSLVYTASSTHVFINRNTFVDDGVVYFEGGGANSVISNNRFESVDGCAIKTGSGFQNCVISKNYIYHSNYNSDTSLAAIYLFTDESPWNYGVSIVGNVVHDCNNHGIALDYGADNCAIVGNVCRDNGGYGVSIGHSSCDDNLIIGNQLNGNTSGGISDSGTNTEKGHNVT